MSAGRSAVRMGPAELVQAAAMARRFYLEGKSKIQTAERGSVEAVRRAAQVSGGDAHPIYAPMLLPDAATAAALRNQTGIARAFEYFDKVTVACVSIGSWEPGISTVHDMLSDEERAH